MEGGYRSATRVLGFVTALLGVCLLVVTIARGGGPLAVGTLIGVAFVVVGAGRIYIAARSRSGP